MGEADAAKELAIGTAQATVIKAKADAVDQRNYAMIEVAAALAKSGFPLVPHIVAGGNSNGGSSIMDLFLAKMLANEASQTDKSKT